MAGGGAVAFWHTMPYQFAVKAIDLGVPAEMNTPDRRQRWLEIIRAEMQAALKTDGNRFLSGWMTAHPITLRTGECRGRPRSLSSLDGRGAALSLRPHDQDP